MTSLTRWTWVWVSSGSWWWTGRPGVLQSMGLQRVRHNWATEQQLQSGLVPAPYHTARPWGRRPCLFFIFFWFLVVYKNHFSRSVVSDSLGSHALQHARLPCPTSTPGAYSDSCPLSQWCHPTISSSVVPFSSHLQSLPASGSFPVSQFFTSGGQSIGVSASATVLPMTIQDWFPSGQTGWISLKSKGLSESSAAPQFKSINSLVLSFLYSPTLTSIQDCWKNHSFD